MFVLGNSHICGDAESHASDYCVEPNEKCRGTAYVPLPVPPIRSQRFAKNIPHSTPMIVSSFKSTVTKRIDEHCPTPGATMWQRNYHELIIRNESDLDAIPRHISENPLTWHLDRENLVATGTEASDTE